MRRHKEEWAAKGIIIKPTTIKDIIGEELHESGLTMREYNEIVDQIKNQKSTTILEPPDNDNNKNDNIHTIKEDAINAQEKEGQQEERQEVEEIDLAAETLETVSAPIKPRRAYNKKKTE